MIKKNNFNEFVYRDERLKKRPLDGSFPNDFWNYEINPITGFKDQAIKETNDLSTGKKYATNSSPINWLQDGSGKMPKYTNK